MDLKEQIKNKALSADVLNAISTMSFPLMPEDYVEVLPYVYEQGDKTIKENVAKSLSDLSFELLSSFIEKAEDEKVLIFYFQYFLKVDPNPEILIKILNNPNCPPSIFSLAARCNFSEVLTFLVNNVQILKKHKDIFNALLENKFLDGFLKQKLEEYRQFGMLEDKKTVRIEEKDGEAELIGEETVEDEETARLKEQLIEEAKKEGVELTEKSDLKVSEKDLGEKELTLYQKLLRMTVSQKIDRALKGTKEERTLLIRDSNKVVAMAVIQSPKITEQEVAAIAGMRNVHKDVLRYIGTNRQFLKKYRIILALVKNPKTPPDIALTLLKRIGERDLKSLVRDRGISEFVRQAASRLLKSRKR